MSLDGIVAARLAETAHFMYVGLFVFSFAWTDDLLSTISKYYQLASARK